MLFVHDVIGTWSSKVDAYIALTEFQKRKMVEGGLPESRIHIKPNGLDSPEYHRSAAVTPAYALFVGRLSVEKGCHVLLRSWLKFVEGLGAACENESRPRLLIAGDGPQRRELERIVEESGLKSIEFLGRQPRGSVLKLMNDSLFLVVPSIWYEGLPMTIVEAFACGVPVVTSDCGGMKEIVDDGVNGLKFAVGNDEDLRDKLMWAFGHFDEMKLMREQARSKYERDYSEMHNLRALESIYSTVIQSS